MSADMKDFTEIPEKAKAFARVRHAGQKDKAGVDYFEGHLSAVASRAAWLGGPAVEAVAWLHDVIEDTGVTKEELAEQFPPEIVEAVATMTHRECETYADYIQRVKQNRLARIVKICDLSHNMDLSRLPEVTEKDEERIRKYVTSFVELMK